MGTIDRIESMRTLIVPPGQAPERIDVYIARSILGATRNKVQEAIDVGAVVVNGRTTRSNYKVRGGDEIAITLMKPPPIELIAQDIPLDIIYEDGDLLVVNKPAGMVTHPGFGNRDGTLVNALLFYAGENLPALRLDPADDENDPIDTGDGCCGGDGAEVPRPGIVHRLDKETSGLLVVAKNVSAQAHLARQFAERTARREYRAVVWGVVEEEEGVIEGNIARDPRDRKRFAVTHRGGKPALTRWRVIERYPFATLVALRLATGRTHQIRVHCAYTGHPVFGDATYGGREVVCHGPGAKHRQHVMNLLGIIQRQALHARTLGFTHPTTQEWLEFESELPDDMRSLIEALR